MSDYTHIINGAAVTSSGKINIINPANLRKIAEVPVATKEQLDETISAARKAFPLWSAKTPEERAEVLLKMALVIEQNMEEYKQILTSEQGKTLADAEFELGVCVASLRGTAELRLPEVVLFENDETKIVERRVAIGVELSYDSGHLQARTGCLRRKYLHPQTLTVYATDQSQNDKGYAAIPSAWRGKHLEWRR
ncbi:hypothetical protein RSAG8_09829, partial [Rhizoctonia solani AG-8 WAC10335]